jgi:type VI secretion system secreted protein VgrG
MDFEEEGFFEGDASEALVLRTPLGSQPILTRLQTVEALSEPFRFELTLVSKAQRPIDRAALLGVSITASVRSAVEEVGLRHFTGHVVEFTSCLGERARSAASYKVVLRPWFWLLSLRKRCRIFQQRTTLEIMKTVCDEHGFGKLLDDGRLLRRDRYPKREYCVQYNESDFAFLSRLLEHEGIYYYFEHTRTEHKMVLVDDPSVHVLEPKHSKLWQYPRWGDTYYIGAWDETDRLRAKRHELDDYDYLAPTRNLKVKLASELPFTYAQGDQFEYPGGYLEEPIGTGYVDGRTNEQNASVAYVEGTWSLLGPAVGSAFTTEFAAKEYLLTEASNDIRFQSAGRNPLILDRHTTGPSSIDIAGSFRAIDKAIPFKPVRKTPRPRMASLQTGMVVGDDASALEGLLHTDEHGRVRVRFHWYDVSEDDQQRSCWVRVAQPWAGNAWGSQFIPRVGHEVVVAFIDGDQDRPLIVGSVYNGLNYAPFALPDGSVSGFMTDRAVQGGVSERQPNVLAFDDSKGQIAATAEKVKVTAQGAPESSIAIKAGLASIDVGGLMQSIGMQAAKETSVVAGMEISATAGLALTFATVGSFIKIEPTGITMVGPTVSINTPVFKTTTIPIPGPPTPDVILKTEATTKDTTTALAQLAAGGVLP